MDDFGAGLETFFKKDHNKCDEIWAKFEVAADKGDNEQAAELWTAFEARMKSHLSMEEEILFPAFEAATGMRGGPTQVMRTEHQQMRAILAEMATAGSQGDMETVLDHGDTLLMLIQQHNVKEEGILYPMAEQALASEWSAIADKIRGRFYLPKG